jgi:hypothetical protein
MQPLTLPKLNRKADLLFLALMPNTSVFMNVHVVILTNARLYVDHIS